MRLGYLWLLAGSFCFLVACAAALAQEEPAGTESGIEVRLQSVARGMSVPVGLTQAGDGSDRLFILDQTGQILILGPDGELLAEPFLDISDRLVELEPSYDERGLLGLAFHPDYRDNGRFLVYYSAPLRDEAPEDWDHTSHISEFTVSGDDPDRADLGSEQIVLQVDQPYNNHNAGQISFGPDGYLYIPLGDGGNAGDMDAAGEDLGRPERGNAQTIDTLLGSILRIDVDAGDGEPYGVPDDNVFVGEDGADEIFAYGFRNPYGLSFDQETGDLFVTDAGQARYEEASLVEPGGNHGWNIKEGTHCFNPDDFLNPPPNCPDTGARGEPLVDPVIEYERGPESGATVVPGVRYHGQSVPDLEDHFVFGDYASIRFLPTGVLYAAAPDSDDEGLWPIKRVSLVTTADEPGELDRFLLGVYQDLDGRMYVLTSREGGPTGETGEVFAIRSVTDAERAGFTSPVWIAVGGVAVLAVILVAVLVGRRRRERGPSAGESG